VGRLRNPDYVPEQKKPVAERKAVSFTRNKPAFLRALRNAVFELLKMLSRGATATVLTLIEPSDPDGLAWNRQRIESLLDNHLADHDRIRLDPGARAAKHTRISGDAPRRWLCEQVLVDSEVLNDWWLKLTLDLDRCDAAGAVVLILEGLAAV
jgi:hypothetical protein